MGRNVVISKNVLFSEDSEYNIGDDPLPELWHSWSDDEKASYILLNYDADDTWTEQLESAEIIAVEVIDNSVTMI